MQDVEDYLPPVTGGESETDYPFDTGSYGYEQSAVSDVFETFSGTFS